jgi:nucleoside-triphosphatase
MNKCFLLTGKPRIGKSTAIKRIIHRIGTEYFGGFYTEEIRNFANRTGFNCVTLSGESVCFASIDSSSTLRVGRYGIDIDAFENIALQAVRQSLSTKRITVIDEIGFMQMLSFPFREMIHEIFARQQHTILGAICLDSHPVIDQIKELHGVKLYYLNEECRESIIEEVANDVIMLADTSSSKL